MTTPTLENQLCYALYAASSRVTSIYRPMLEEIDVTYPQFMVLMALWQQEEFTITGLSERTLLGKSTLSPLLKLMEKKNLLSRKTDDIDERIKIIKLTLQGRKLAKKAEIISASAFSQTGLTKKEAETIRSLCQKLLINSEKPE